MYESNNNNNHHHLLGIGTSYFNDLQCLKRQIKSIFPIPTRLKDNIVYIGVDGRFRGYDLDKPDTRKNRKSTDGSYELIKWFQKQHKIRVINTVTPNTLDERNKRQVYVDIAGNIGCDFLLILDADEYFEVIDWNRLFDVEFPTIISKEWGNVHAIKFIDLVDDVFGKSYVGYRPRLWWNPKDMVYTTKHYVFQSIQNIDKPPVHTCYEVPDTVVRVVHNPKDCRSSERNELRVDYEKRLEGLELGLM